MKRYIIIFLITLVGTASKADNNSMRLIETLQLPSSEKINCLFTDSDGMLWIGTSTGLMGYDGYHYTTLHNHTTTGNNLPGNDVRCMVEDRNNQLWVGTTNGTARIDRRNGRVTAYPPLSYWQRIIYNMYVTRDNTLWLCTDAGLLRYRPEKDDFVLYDSTNSHVTDAAGRRLAGRAVSSVKSLAEDADGSLYVGTWRDGLYRLNRKTNVFETIISPPTPQGGAFSLLLDTRGRLWVGTWEQGLARIDNPGNPHMRTIHSYEPQGNTFRTIYRIAEDKTTGSILACSRSGIMVVDNDKAAITSRIPASAQGLQQCHDMATDVHGNIWIADLSGRIAYTSPCATPFATHSIERTRWHEPLCGTTAMATTDGRHIWMGLQPYGMACHDLQSGKTLFNEEIGALKEMNTGLYETFAAIMPRGNGDMWIGSKGLGVIIVGKDGRLKARYTKQDVAFMEDDIVTALCESRNGTVWIGQSTRLGYTDGKGNDGIVSDRNGHCMIDVRDIYEDRHGRIWVSTDNAGIMVLEGKKIKKQYDTGHGNSPVNDASQCVEDNEGRMWAVSNSGGLMMLDSKKDVFGSVNEQYGTDGFRIISICKSADGALWMTSPDAILCMTTDDDGQTTVLPFSHADGIGQRLSGRMMQYGNTLYTGSGDGVTTFNPADVVRFVDGHEKKARPALVVSDIMLDGISITKTNEKDKAGRKEFAMPHYAKEITVEPDVNKIAIELTLLSYIAPTQNRYAYKLERYSKKWNIMKPGHRVVTFENLPPGTYTLKVKAADNYGKWQNLPYDITIRVLPPWYLTPWAILIYILALAGGVAGGVILYHRHVRTANQLQMGVLLTNITHELLTPLTVIQAAVDKIRTDKDDNEQEFQMIENNIGRLIRLMRQVLEVRKSQAGELKLHVAEDNLATFVANVCDMVRPLMNAKSICLNTELPDTLMAWFDRDKVDKIIYNLLSNATKYSNDGGRIDVTLDTDGGFAVLTVKDNGIGITPQKMKRLYTRYLDGDYRQMKTMGTGLGLSLTRDLVKLHHGTIHCESAVGQGTTFTVRLPMAELSYTDTERSDDRPAATAGHSGGQQPEAPNGTTDTDATTADREYSVLIVEDNEELLTLMKHGMEQHYNVYTAKNGEQALKVIARHGLDVVVTDVMMPVMDGIELTRRIKKSEEWQALPVIMLTAKTRDEDRDEAWQAGADEYLKKPFGMQSLMLRVNNIISNRELVRKKFAGQTELQLEEQHCSSPDETFVRKAAECVKQHIADADYDRDTFAEDMCVSPSTLYNKLRALTGQNILGFISTIRMQEAIRIARRNPDIQINELSARVGFNTPKYFSKCFKNIYGMPIKEYIKAEKEKK